MLSHQTSIRGADGLPNAHVVAVVGYAVDRNLWHPQAVRDYDTPPPAGTHRPLDVAKWVRHLIVHDENFGPYRTLGIRSFPPTNTAPPPALIADAPIGVLRRAVWYWPTRIREIAREFLSELADVWLDFFPENAWTRELFDKDKRKDQVIRPLVILGADYVAHLRDLPGASQVRDEMCREIEKVIQRERTYWMVEISNSLLFTGRDHKVADILILDVDGRSEPAPTEIRPWVLIRFPGGVQVSVAKDADGSVEFAPLAFDVDTHVPMYHPIAYSNRHRARPAGGRHQRLRTGTGTEARNLLGGPGSEGT